MRVAAHLREVVIDSNKRTFVGLVPAAHFDLQIILADGLYDRSMRPNADRLFQMQFVTLKCI
ncbi:hypothetical protein NNRS527_01512 [Nitrosospira sp. NRS527]|nr:hypothetical protein NNRS527_01512 [Nitrosospira sp. NRS527]